MSPRPSGRPPPHHESMPPSNGFRPLTARSMPLAARSMPPAARSMPPAQRFRPLIAPSMPLVRRIRPLAAPTMPPAWWIRPPAAPSIPLPASFVPPAARLRCSGAGVRSIQLKRGYILARVGWIYARLCQLPRSRKRAIPRLFYAFATFGRSAFTNARCGEKPRSALLLVGFPGLERRCRIKRIRVTSIRTLETPSFSLAVEIARR